MPVQIVAAGIPIGVRGRRRGIPKATSLLLGRLLVVLPLYSTVTAQTGAKPERPRIAVLAFELIDVNKAEGVATEDQLRDELVKNDIYTVVDRAQTDKVLKELHFQQIGLTDQDKALKLGKLLNVQLIVTGRLTALTGAIQFNVQMIEVQTAEINRSETLLHRGHMLGLISEKVPVVAARLSLAKKPRGRPDLEKLAAAAPPPEEKQAAEPEKEDGGFFAGLLLWTGIAAAVFSAVQYADAFDKDSEAKDLAQSDPQRSSQLEAGRDDAVDTGLAAAVISAGLPAWCLWSTDAAATARSGSWQLAPVAALPGGGAAPGLLVSRRW